jgi:hypothetical protein
MNSDAFPKNDIVGLTHLILDTNEDDAKKIEHELLYSDDPHVDNTDVVQRFKEDLTNLSTSFSLDEEEHIEPSALPENVDIAGSTNLALPATMYKTQEEKTQQYVDHIMGDYAGEGTQFDLSDDFDTQEKNKMLGDIEELIYLLKQDGIDVENIPHVNTMSSMRDIKTAYELLRHKSDRYKNAQIANDFILMLVVGLETYFDGKREIWGGRKPNLTGWSATVKTKLRRIQFETSTIVRDMMQTYHVSPFARILMEFVPSAIAYSAEKERSQTDNLATQHDFEEKIDDLNRNNF